MSNNPQNKPVVKLENWVKLQYGVDTESSKPQFVLYGDCKDHPRLGNTNVRTSLVVDTDDKTYANTLNTHYVLGTPSA